ncbi:MAG: FtsH protease activity modulator HflK [Proteobacteria bacterium]|nr:FtsH protease activity modulator HflK [Pseudomonadota bacterium]
MSWDWEKLKNQQESKQTIPPQMENFFKKFSDKKIPGLPIIILVIFVLFLASSMFYTIGIDEVGIVQRFGKYTKTTQPGLNFKLPAGIEKVTKLKIRRVYKKEFGFSSTRPEGRQLFSSPTVNENISLMLTGDLNVALAPWIVHYRINDPYNFLFKIREVDSLLSDMSEAAMRLVIGDRSINEVISKREEIADEAKIVLQAELDKSEAGISIATIEMEKTNVPEPVQPSFNEVNQAVQEKEKLIYQAKEEYNKELPKARGEAERTIRIAEGYALDRVNRAKGDASRFVALYTEYVKAKDVTQRRMYLEMLNDLLPKLGNKYIIDADQKNLLPFLNLANQTGATKNEK